MHLQMSSAQCRPFCQGLSVLKTWFANIPVNVCQGLKTDFSLDGNWTDLQLVSYLKLAAIYAGKREEYFSVGSR